ncbi:hypothetical protein GCM10010459_23750 [Microbacterium schleiferi]|jgi:hypothetical protein
MTGCRGVGDGRYCRVMASRVLAPDLSGIDKPKGPASYFSSIEKTYGRPVQDWIDIAVERLDAGDAHMAVVEALKTEHGLGHGHANAVVAYTKAALAQG